MNMPIKQKKQIIFVIISFLIILVIVCYLVYTNYIIPQTKPEVTSFEKVNPNIDTGAYDKLHKGDFTSYGSVSEPKNVGKIDPFRP